MTHNHHENLSMMDAVTTKYGRTTFVTVSKTLAIILVVIFFICLIATGLLVYSFSSTCSTNDTVSIESEALKVTDNTSVLCEPNRKDSVKKVYSEPEYVSPTVLLTTTPTSTRKPLTEPSSTKASQDTDIRLPKSIVPEYYTLHLVPFIREGNFTFNGEVTIRIKVLNSTDNITLHADTLKIENVGVMNVKNESVSVKDVRTVEAKEFLVIDLDEDLDQGQQYYVHIVFKGILNDMLEGFYRSSYVENNITRWLAATQFQATDARKAFPCFDEPAFKAKFQINLARLKNMSTISNMRKIGTTEEVKDLPGYVWDHYEETLKMSTYLVAFVVSDFHYISKGIFSIWAKPSSLAQANYSLEIGPKILKYYEMFFGIKYPLPKVDMVAIPDFSAGAMENWGLITYREPVLLYEEGISSKFNKQRAAHVVAHELAHQWFGNLVTPVWWEDLWLNEGFATYVEYLGSHFVNPKWKDLDLFLVNELQESLSLDALKSSHPISVKVNNPDEVGDLFDKISYSKGASIIRMMKFFLGNEVFQKGLKKYLENRIYSNAEQDDLWNTLTEESLEFKVLPENVTVKEIMDTWTLQTGYPVVTAIREKNGDLKITQERFLLDRKENELDKTLWWVPITVVDDNKTKKTWLKNERQIEIKQALSQDNKWYLVNLHQNGYYRVNYNEENWKAIVDRLQGNGHRHIHARNRAQILDDSFKLAGAGYLSYDIALNTTLYLRFEKEYVPWKAALTNFQFIYNMFVRSGHFDKFKAYVTALIADFYKELTFKEANNEDPLMILNRMEIIRYTCYLGYKDCILEAVQQFQNWRNSPNPDLENTINPDLRETVYCTAISDGGQEEWDFAWNMYLSSNVEGDKEIILSALSCSKEVWILSRYLEWSITEDSGIRKHDTAKVFACVSENPIGHDLVYSFLKTNWKRITKYLGSSSSSFSSIITTTTAKFNTEEEVNDFKSFFQRNKEEFGVAFRTAQQAIELGEANTVWMKKYFNTVVSWFKNTKLY